MRSDPRMRERAVAGLTALLSPIVTRARGAVCLAPSWIVDLSCTSLAHSAGALPPRVELRSRRGLLERRQAEHDLCTGPGRSRAACSDIILPPPVSGLPLP